VCCRALSRQLNRTVIPLSPTTKRSNRIIYSEVQICYAVYVGSRKDLLKLVVREGRFDWTPTATDDVYLSVSLNAQPSVFTRHALRDTVSRQLHGLSTLFLSLHGMLFLSTIDNRTPAFSRGSPSSPIHWHLVYRTTWAAAHVKRRPQNKARIVSMMHLSHRPTRPDATKLSRRVAAAGVNNNWAERV